METNELFNKLNSLIRLDNDALVSYRKAVESISDPLLATEISRFQADHERHVEDLSSMVKKLGGMSATKETDIRGLFLGSATTLQSILGVEGLLKALHTGEKLTNKDYEEAVKWDVPTEVNALLAKNYQDEQRHITFIEKALRDKIWEKR